MARINGQLLIYLGVGAVLLLVGLNSIRGEKPEAVSGAPVAGDAATTPEGGGFAVSSGGRKLVVDISGEVRRPGVYRFRHGSRVIDAIARAGGTTRRAFVGAINRAATLSDGQQVVVPRAGPGGSGAVSAEGAAVAGAADVPVSLGTATQEQLEEIDGIGPVTAQKILEFRDGQGRVGSIDELDEISGIGPVTMESLRAALTP